MRFKAFSAFAVLALLVAGCGGGGGGTGSSAAARVGVFVTDDLGSYDHVWVTIKAISLVGPAGTKTVYSDPVGKSIDLSSLNAAGAATFAFLGIGAIPEGTYTRIDVTLDENLVLFPAGATVGLNRTFAGASGGQKVLAVHVDDGGEAISGDDSLVIDFNLATWTDDGTQVTAVAAVRGHEGLDDPARHHGEDYKGTVSGLTSAGFNLVPRSGVPPIAVTIDTNTIVYGDLSTLADGQKVEVRGTFSPTTQTLLATSVKIENGDHHSAESRGVVASLGTGSFDLTTSETDGFLPSSSTVHVAYSSSTIFRGDHGANLSQTDFEAILATGVSAEVEGAYDAGTNTLTATKIKLEVENEGGDGGGGGDHGG